MTNTFLDSLKTNTNYGYTENGAVKHVSTLNHVLDLFAFGGSYRKRTEEDCIYLFEKAFSENPTLALKCLFYLRDCRGGQGERRFFRVCMKWLVQNHAERIAAIIPLIPEYGRYDDWWELLGINPVVDDLIIDNVESQLSMDMTSKKNGISLLAKWMPSENASSNKTVMTAKRIRKALHLSAKQYRQILSKLRKKIKVLERLMSNNEWEKIEFDKIPSKAGLLYKNAFARRDVIAEKYKSFMQTSNKKVNATVLNPQNVVNHAIKAHYKAYDDATRLAINKYWENLPDYYGDNPENGIAIVDVSGSMYGTPMEAAIGLGAYIAEKAHGPFANHFITFSQSPALVEFTGTDFVEKVSNTMRANWGYNTNLEAVFDLLLTTARDKRTRPEDMPTRLYIFSDMEFDDALSDLSDNSEETRDTLIEGIAKKWERYGYKLPQIVFWNLDARTDNIPAIGGNFSYISGFSPVMIEQVLSGKTGEELMLDKLNSDRYKAIYC